MAEMNPHPTMHKRVERKPDGRMLIYYSFAPCLDNELAAELDAKVNSQGCAQASDNKSNSTVERRDV
jgi:hypothetical protein